MPLRARRDTVPTVVFADHTRWGAFTQLAAAVRRAGGRAVRVTVERRDWRTRLTDRLLFDRAIHLDGRAALSRVASLLADETVVDVQCTEYVCRGLAGADDAFPEPVGSALATRANLLDKYTVGELATAGGVRTPTKLAADRVTVEEAVDRLGLPLVVKARVGAAGDMVRIVSTLDDARRALDELDPDPANLFFERLVVGEDIDYSAVVGPDGVVLDAATRTVAAPPGSTTPPARIEVVDEPDLLEFGRQAVKVLGFTGVAHLDTVRDGEGRYWLIDLNLRAWGSMIPAGTAGVDFADAYLHTLGLRDGEPPAPPPPGNATVTVFPRVMEDALGRGHGGRAARAFLTHSWWYLRRLGVRYWLGELLSLAGGLAGTVRR
jgi:hypothetical protein